MNAVLLTWRWQNILAIWIMVIALGFVVMGASQISMYSKGKAAANVAS